MVIQAHIELEVASRSRIKTQSLAALLNRERPDMRHGCLLRFANVLQERPRGRYRKRQLIGTEAFEVESTQLIRQETRGARELKMPGRTRTQRASAAGEIRGEGLVRAEKLRRLQPFKLSCERKLSG